MEQNRMWHLGYYVGTWGLLRRGRFIVIKNTSEKIHGEFLMALNYNALRSLDFINLFGE